MHLLELITLLVAGLLGGVINAVAGGGSFVTLPALMFFNVPPTIANATSAIAAWPGLLTAAYGYRKRLLLEPRATLRYAITSLVGGVIGGTLLLLTPASVFARAIPLLMLAATLLFCFAPRLARAISVTKKGETQHSGHVTRARAVVQFVASLMVGYFNAGSGIIVMAALSLCGMRETQMLNGFKNLLGAIAAGASIAALAVGGQIAWTLAGLMMTGSLIGGLVGARFAQRINAGILRALIIAFSLLGTAYFFSKFWL